MQACLRFVCSPAPTASQRKALLVFHQLSSVWVLLGPAGRNWTSVPIWRPGCCGCRLVLTALETTGLHWQPAMISVNFLISQPFALHVVSVTVSLLPRLPSASMCSFCPYLSVHTVPLQQQEGWSVRVTDSRRENKATHRACVIGIWREDREQPERGGEKSEKSSRGRKRVDSYPCVNVYMFHWRACKVCAQNSLYFDINSLAHQQHFPWPLDVSRHGATLMFFCEQQLDHEIAFKQGASGQPRLIQWWHAR